MFFGLYAKNNRGKQEEICQIYFVELSMVTCHDKIKWIPFDDFFSNAIN